MALRENQHLELRKRTSNRAGDGDDSDGGFLCKNEVQIGVNRRIFALERYP